MKKQNQESSTAVASPGSDPATKHYEKALRLMFDGKFAKAEAGFQAVIEETDSRQLQALARQYQAACRRQGAADDANADGDPYLAAVYEKNRGNLETALKLIEGQTEGNADYLFLAASIHALGGDEEKALTLLEDAIRLEPKIRVHAFNDPDFSELRGQEGFDALVKHP